MKQSIFLLLVVAACLAACLDSQEARDRSDAAGASIAVRSTPPSPPVTRTLAASGTQRAATTIDRQTGAVYVAWTQKTDGRYHVVLARAHEADSTPVRVSAPDDTTLSAHASPKVQVGPDGTVYVAWTNRIPIEGRTWPGSNILLAASTDSGRTFDAPVFVNDDAEGLPTEHGYHDLAVGPDGTVYVAWIDFRVQDSVRVARRRGSQAHVQGPRTQPFRPVGHAVRHDGPGAEIRLAYATDGGRTFSRNVVVDDRACECCPISVAVGADGAVYVMWRKIFEDNIRDMAVARSTDGGRTFSEAVRVHEDNWQINGCPHVASALTVDEAGRVYAGWYTGQRAQDGLYYAVSADGGATFGTSVGLVSGVAKSEMQLRAGHDGEVWGVWEDKSGSTPRLLMARLDQPTPPIEIAQGTSPVLAVHGRQRAVVWVNEGIHVRYGIEE